MTQTSDDSTSDNRSGNGGDLEIKTEMNMEKERDSLNKVNKKEKKSDLSSLSSKKESNPDAADITSVAGMKWEPEVNYSLIPRGVPACVVCGEPCLYYCKSCKKTSYCSKEHQKQHWKEHRPDCYPVQVQFSSVHGTHLVVTRDVRRGEVILRERPLVSAPVPIFSPQNANDSSSAAAAASTICLSCNKMILPTSSSSDENKTDLASSSSTVCSKCGWPVCSAECEMNATHAEQECKIFAEYQVETSALCDKPTQYLCVALVRALLLSSSSSSDDNIRHKSKWSQLMELMRRQDGLAEEPIPVAVAAAVAAAEGKEDHHNHQHHYHHQQKTKPRTTTSSNTEARCFYPDPISKSLGSIIHQQFPDADIDQILRTLRNSSFITNSSSRSSGTVNGSSALCPSSSSSSSAAPTTEDVGEKRINNNFNLGRTTAEVEGNARTGRRSGKTRCLYQLASLLTSNCIPNCSWLIQEEPSLEFYLRANMPIKTGERLTICFVDSLLGTEGRRESLFLRKGRYCRCGRCSDPTESSTFFSAIKCPGDGGCGCEGYLLPTDPLSVSYCYAEDSHHQDYYYDHSDGSEKLWERKEIADWKCTVCLMKQPWEYQRNLVERMISSVKKKEEEEEEGNFMIQTLNLDKVQELLDKIGSFPLHPNHFLVVRLELEVLGKLSKFLEEGIGKGEGGQVPLEQMETCSLKMIELCKKGLKVVNILCPGLSLERGRLLYFLQQAVVISLLFRTSRTMRIKSGGGGAAAAGACGSGGGRNSAKESDELTKKFYELLLARKEIHEIFAVTREGSEEERMLRAVQHDSIEIRLLKKHFKFHQNNWNYNYELIQSQCANSTIL